VEVGALERLGQVCTHGIGNLALLNLPQARLAHMGEERRLATLRAFVPALKRTAADDILALCDGLLTALALRGDKRTTVKAGDFARKANIKK
jgi:hypothetical protein